jgi:hypothetical protein
VYVLRTGAAAAVYAATVGTVEAELVLILGKLR